MSLVALAGPLGWAHWSRHWPLGFVALAAFIYLRAAANDGIWPFGAFGRAEVDAEALQHLLAAMLVLALGLFEWWARSNEKRPAWSHVFPLLAMTGGILLLTHSHTAFEPKPAFLVQATHSAIGALAGLVAAGRWLELRLAPPGSRVAGAVAGGAMLAIALVLVFYREANVVIPR
jgi:putative copper resistance protein D